MIYCYRTKYNLFLSNDDLFLSNDDLFLSNGLNAHAEYKPVASHSSNGSHCW